jgi:hypothetical protein
VSGRWKGNTLIETFRYEGGEFVRRMGISPDGKKIAADWRFTPIAGAPESATEVLERQ